MEDRSERKADGRDSPAGIGRKPYTKPSVREYGDVADLTRSVGRTGTNADGGHAAGMRKTS